MTREEKIDKILDELLDDFIKAKLPLMKGMTLFAKVQNAVNYIENLPAEPCDDAISRQAVITRIKELCNPYGKPQIDFEVGKKMIEWFKAMPPVQPIRPKGKWIDREEYDVDRWKCSKCGNTEQYHEDFCPNCGADMRGNEG